ncbi:uncharacterized protein [Battus philenor]|uniref:uncharacterized protein n=1 Tax=Battus philenor TaxID=42288 RepID=UPI0035D074F6
MVVKNYEVAESFPVPVRSLNLASETYVVVKNHVRELKNDVQNKTEVYTRNEHVETQCTKQNSKTKKHLKRKLDPVVQNGEDCKISKSDLEELKTVYFHCKRVLQNIETKYGHLLELSDRQKSTSDEEFENEEECTCDQNKKIIFDDEGNEILKDDNNDKHICLKKLKCKKNLSPENPCIQIEYDNEILEPETHLELPDNLIDLGNMLKKPRLETKHKTAIVKKMKRLRFEYINELRFNKQMLVEKLKVNPDEVLLFSGTNLSTLSGYM